MATKNKVGGAATQNTPVNDFGIISSVFQGYGETSVTGQASEINGLASSLDVESVAEDRTDVPGEDSLNRDSLA